MRIKYGGGTDGSGPSRYGGSSCGTSNRQDERSKAEDPSVGVWCSKKAPTPTAVSAAKRWPPWVASTATFSERQTIQSLLLPA